MAQPPPPRDLDLLDAVDAFARAALDLVVWRVCRCGRDPLDARRARGRWGPGAFDILYTAVSAEGAIAEIFSLLADQPVFPADAAFFLGFDALLVPSARWRCRNLVLFTEHLGLADVEVEATEDEVIDFAAWRKRAGR